MVILEIALYKMQMSNDKLLTLTPRLQSSILEEDKVIASLQVPYCVENVKEFS